MSADHSIKQKGWQAIFPMGVARSHPSVAHYEGKIYVIGGGAPAFRSLNTVEIYNPETDRWSLGREMPTARSGMATFVIQGKIYVVGGGFKQPNGKFKFLKTVEVYDPQADRWEEGPEMLQPHDYPASALLGDQMYILGGHHPDATEGGPQTDPGFAFCERFDFASGGWMEIAPLPKPRFAAAAVAFDGKVLAFGGVAFTGQDLTEYDRVEVYDPRKGDWSVASWSMPWSAAAHGACLHGGSLYLFGGFSGDQGIGTQAAHYDFTRGEWEKIPTLPEARAAMGVTVVEGSIYLVGGWAADRSVMDSVIAYTP